MSNFIYKFLLFALLILISFSCKKWTLSKEEKEKCLEKPSKENGFLIYEVNENFAASKNVPSTQLEYDINCDGIADFRFVGSIQMFLPSEGWRSSTILCLHSDAFIMGYTSSDTTYTYQDTLIQNTTPPILCYIQYGQSCTDNHDLINGFTVSSNNHPAYLNTADQEYSGTWFSQNFTFQTINTSYLLDEIVTPDTTYRYYETQKLNCWDLSNSGSWFLQFKLKTNKKEITGAFEMTSPNELKSVWVKD